jgi:hypothetical protein
MRITNGASRNRGIADIRSGRPRARSCMDLFASVTESVIAERR